MDARDRLVGARGWIRPDGAPFADTVNDIVQGNLLVPPRVNPFGEQAATPWGAGTATLGVGVVDPSNSCHDWTDARSAMVKVSFGTSSATDSTWTMTPATGFSSTYNFCGYETPFYCFGVDHATALPPPADQGRLAFVTQAGLPPGGGITAADALCDSEAKAAGLPGTFAALLPTSKQSAADRFASFSSAAWVRLDGVALNQAGAVLFDQPELRTPINVTSQKNVVPSVFVLTGSTSPWAVPRPEEVCQDWTATTGYAWAGETGDTKMWWRAAGRQCSETNPIYCLQR